MSEVVLELWYKASMKTLLLMRHAKSSWDNAYQSDHERPLNARGREAAPMMGQLLKREGLVPDCILSSTATRAYQTAERVAEECDIIDKLHTFDDLYHSSPEEIAHIIANHGTGDIVLVVAHNPGMSECITEFSGGYEQMVTAAIAHFQLQIDDWSKLVLDGSAALVNFWIPPNSKSNG